MKYFAPFLLLISALSLLGQSGRTGAAGLSPTPTATPTVKQMFEEANGYLKAKAAEFDAKKIAFSDSLFDRTKLEQRQLAAKYAAAAGARPGLTPEDHYYLGLLHWIAENLEGTAANLIQFVESENPAADHSQTARSLIAVIRAKQGKLEDAEKLLAEYLANDPKKLTERARMEGEIAKAYQARKQFDKMAPHAEQDYAAAKAVVLEPGSMQRGLDEILDSGMLVFEAYRDLGDRTRAEAALDDMRALAVRTQSSPFAYYAIDQKIKYLTETGRKLDAQALYKAALASATSDFTAKEVQEDLTKRLKARDRQYEVLGQRAPEFLTKDQLWFPGKPQTLSELRGKVVVLEFWATWCAPCFDTFPDLIEWHEQFKDQGLVILGVTRYYGQVNGLPADEGRETEELKLFREKWRLPYDFVVGKDQSIQMLYGAMLLPTAAIIDRKGVVRYLETGTSTSRIEQMRDTIVRLLAEK